MDAGRAESARPRWEDCKVQAAQTRLADRRVRIARGGRKSARAREEALASHWQALRSAGEEIQQQVTATLSAARQEWETHLAREIELAQARWDGTLKTTLPEAQNRAIGEMDARGRELFSRLREEAAGHRGWVKPIRRPRPNWSGACWDCVNR